MIFKSIIPGEYFHNIMKRRWIRLFLLGLLLMGIFVPNDKVLATPTNIKAENTDYTYPGVDGRDFTVSWTPSTCAGVIRQMIIIIPSNASEPDDISVLTPVATFNNNTTCSWTGNAIITKDSAYPRESLHSGDYDVYVVAETEEYYYYDKSTVHVSYLKKTTDVVDELTKPVSTEVTQAIFTTNDNTYIHVNETRTMDVAPFIQDGRVYVPLRYVALSLDINESVIRWWPDEQIISILCGYEGGMNLKIGDKRLRSKITTDMDVAPVLVNDRVFLPARYIAEALGYEVRWQTKQDGNIEIKIVDTKQRLAVSSALIKGDPDIPQQIRQEYQNTDYCVLFLDKTYLGKTKDELMNLAQNAGCDFKFSPMSTSSGASTGADIYSSKIEAFTDSSNSKCGFVVGFSQDMSNFTEGIPYLIRTENLSDVYKWRIGENATFMKPLSDPTAELKEVHINGCLLAGDNKIPQDFRRGNVFCYLLVEETPHSKYEGFCEIMSRFSFYAGSEFMLKANGYPDVRVKVSGSCYEVDYSFRAAIMSLIEADRNKIVPGVAYQIVPLGSNSEYKWIIRDNVTVTIK